jgi:hypothetical protein
MTKAIGTRLKSIQLDETVTDIKLIADKKEYIMSLEDFVDAITTYTPKKRK